MASLLATLRVDSIFSPPRHMRPLTPSSEEQKPIRVPLRRSNAPFFEFTPGLQGVATPPSEKARNFQPSYKFKTELCKNFELKNECVFGDNCCFAHGKEELRSKRELNEFNKTKNCKLFGNGFCAHGSRCTFFHLKPFSESQEILDSFEKRLVLDIEAGKSLLDSIEKEVSEEGNSVFSRILQNKRPALSPINF